MSSEEIDREALTLAGNLTGPGIVLGNAERARDMHAIAAIDPTGEKLNIRRVHPRLKYSSELTDAGDVHAGTERVAQRC